MPQTERLLVYLFELRLYLFDIFVHTQYIYKLVVGNVLGGYTYSETCL